MNGATVQTGMSLERLREADLSSTVAALRYVLTEPTSNPAYAVTALVFVVVVALIIIVAALLFLPSTRRRVVRRRAPDAPILEAGEATGPESASAGVVTSEEAPYDTVETRRRRSVALAVLVGGLLLLVLIFGYVATSGDGYCMGSCHSSSVAGRQALEIGHARCVSCHEPAGPLGIFANSADRARMVVHHWMGRSPRGREVSVDSHACLRCHESVLQGIVLSDSGVRMSHREVIEAGQACALCHARSGHTKNAFTSTMSACVVCHNEKIASSACSLCHTSDPGAVGFLAKDARIGLGSGKYVYPAVRAAERKCGAGCHDQARECDTCHGLRMPHSESFVRGAHARPAAFEGKQRCWRCHDPSFCSEGCHEAFSVEGIVTQHVGNWKEEHKKTPWDSGCVCHMQRRAQQGEPRNDPMCYLCHTKGRGLLPIRQ